jgi:hypothetical protein
VRRGGRGPEEDGPSDHREVGDEADEEEDAAEAEDPGHEEEAQHEGDRPTEHQRHGRTQKHGRHPRRRHMPRQQRPRPRPRAVLRVRPQDGQQERAELVEQPRLVRLRRRRLPHPAGKRRRRACAHGEVRGRGGRKKGGWVRGNGFFLRTRVAFL